MNARELEQLVIDELRAQMPSIIANMPRRADDRAMAMVPPDMGAMIRANGNEAKAREIQANEARNRPRPMPAPIANRNVTALKKDDRAMAMIPLDMGAMIRANAAKGR